MLAYYTTNTLNRECFFITGVSWNERIFDIVCEAFLDIRAASEHSEEVFHIANLFHNLADSISKDFEGFIEDGFWSRAAFVQKRFSNSTDYKALFHSLLDGIWVNLDIPTKKFTLHKEKTCGYRVRKAETEFKEINEVRRDGAWIKFDNISDTYSTYKSKYMDFEWVEHC